MRRIIKTTAFHKDGLRANKEILSKTIQLIDSEGKNHGIVSLEKAILIAAEYKLDLVEIVPSADPPVCKILDLGKLKYQNQKKASKTRKKQKTVEIKEIKIRPNIDFHDYNVKLKSIIRFLSEEDKVKITLRFRGREMSHQELGMKVLERIKKDTIKFSRIEVEPKIEGRQIIMILVPR